MGLVKKITKIGNSYGVIIPSEIMALVGMKTDSDVEITVEGGTLLIHPTVKEDRKVMESFSKFMRQYPETLKKLAK